MKDFTSWHSAIFNAKTVLILKSIEEELAQFHKKSDSLEEGYSLKPGEVAILRKFYSEKMKKLTDETIDPKDRPKPKFNK